MDGGHVISEEMRVYCTNESVCHGKLLMSAFENSPTFDQPNPTHLCCDICAQTCSCSDCDQAETDATDCIVSSEELQSIVEEDRYFSSPELLTEVQQQAVINKIITYRDSLCQETPIIFGHEIVTCLPNSIINKIGKQAATINDISHLLDLGIVSVRVAQDILDIIWNVRHT